MSESFQVPDVTRIPLSPSEQWGEEWVEVKNGLTAGEDRQMTALAYIPVELPSGKVVERRDLSQWEFLRDMLWLLAWHIHDPEGKTVPLSMAALKALTPERFTEMDDLIYAHIVKAEALRAAKKKTPPPKPKEDPISSS